ncbi:MAG: fatty acid desaturase [Myxococcales bacterium]|nr:fatty acid desaturase [Myxococcales bacterium]
MAPRGGAAAEWPTWALVVVVYAGWAWLVLAHASIPWWVFLPLGGWFIAWHGSLQHEAVHLHPTRSERVNALIASWPLAIYLPFASYRESHRAHHGSRELGHPVDDTESYYLLPADWDKRSRLERWARRFLQTVAGRMILGPVVTIASVLRGEFSRLIFRRDPRHLRVWAVHLVQVVVVLAFVTEVAGMSVIEYLVFFVFPGVSLSLLRSFLEHRPSPTPEGRTAIVESGGPLSLLFLHNNLHVVHHAEPALPWYQLPARYRAERAAWNRRAAGHSFRGYGEVVQRYFLREKDSPIYPVASPLRGPR